MNKQAVAKELLAIAGCLVAGRKWVTKLISPSGRVFWEAYGPMAKDRDDATLFNNPKAAEKAALGRFGRSGIAFWESERRHESLAKKKYQRWKYEVEEAGLEASRTAADPDLEAVADVVRNNSFLGLRGPLKALRMRKVDFDYSPEAHWSIKTRRGKTIIVINKKYADPGPRDIVVDDFIVGYQ